MSFHEMLEGEYNLEELYSVCGGCESKLPKEPCSLLLLLKYLSTFDTMKREMGILSVILKLK